MSLEDQYDAWVRSVTGTGRHSATKQDRDAAQNSLNAMQAQLDALAESQKRQKSAADALNAVQRAGAATADSVRRMSSELTQSLRQDGLLGGKTAQPAPAAEPVKAGPENFNGLADRVRNFPGQLSGGEQQRVAIARALAKNPKLLLCDEPTGALDYETGKAILKLLQDTCRDTGRTVVVVTHNSAFTAIADRVIHVREGSVAAVELNEAPLSADVLEW